MTNPFDPQGPSAAQPAARPHINPLTGLSPTGRWLLALGAIAFLACASPKPAGSGSAGPTQTGGAPAAPAAGASKDAPAPIGTEVSPAKDWTVTVTATSDDTDAIVKANMFNRRVPGDRLISATLSVHNGSDRPNAPLGQLKLGALTIAGIRVEPSFAVAGMTTINLTTQIQPGATLTGPMVFELAPADADTAVLLAEPQFTADVNEDQRFLALR